MHKSPAKQSRKLPPRPDQAPLLGLAPLKNWPALLLLSFGFALFFLVFYGGASYLSGLVPWRLRVDFDFESRIPFIPAFSLVYLSMDLLVGLAPFVFRSWQRLLPIFIVLCLQTLLASVCFILFPVETNFPERLVQGDHALAFLIADTMNLERNFLPSLHVGFAVTAAMAFSDGRPLFIKVGFYIWALLIAASTTLIHEHHLLDVVAGWALAWYCWSGPGRRMSRASWQERITIEWIIIKNTLVFARRHLRYLWIGLALQAVSLKAYSERRVLRSGFCFLQIVDDLLDLDRPCDEEPLVVVDRLRRAIRENCFESDDGLMKLARVFRSDLLEVGGQAALAKALQLIAVMQNDRRRVLKAAVWSAEQIKKQLQQTFELSVDLMMIAARADLRAIHVPELIEAFGWCSVMRDLEEDLNAGLINIPAETLGQMGLPEPVQEHLNYENLLGEPVIRDWIKREFMKAAWLLDQSDCRLDQLRAKSGFNILYMFSRSIRKYVDSKLPARYVWLKD